MLSIIIILSIALAIFLGYRTKINTGLFSVLYLLTSSDVSLWD